MGCGAVAKVEVPAFLDGWSAAKARRLGASGARLTTVLLHELERTGGRYGLQTICEGGGMANGMIIERI